MFPSRNGDSEIVDEPRVINLMHDFADTLRSTVPQLFREFGAEKAQEFIDDLKFKISAQLFDHVPLSDGHYKWKVRHGLDPRILIETSEYLESFMFEELTHDSSGVVFRVGVPAVMHRSSGLPMKMLQRILEYGTNKGGRTVIPARPHWRPEIIHFQSRAEEMGREFRSQLATQVARRMHTR